jgi:hypothetical protein
LKIRSWKAAAVANGRTDHEIDLLYGEIVDLRTLYRAISLDFEALKKRFNLSIVTTAALTLVVGGARLLDYLQSVL